MERVVPEGGPIAAIQRSVLRRMLALGLPPGARILDAPCGQGTLTAALYERGFDVWATDLEDRAARALGDRFRAADLNGRLPWDAASFDAVASVEGIEHLENPFSFLRELRRLLRPGGSLLLTTPNIVCLRSRLRFFASGFYHRDRLPLNETGSDPMRHIALRTFPDLRYALHTCGFRLVDVGCTHWKAVSWLYAPLVPWMWLYTRAAFRREKDPAQRERNRDILSALFAPSVLVGENLMLLARRDEAPVPSGAGLTGSAGAA